MIQPKPTTVGEILTLSKHFIVPKYQRGYEWESEEAEEYLSDLDVETASGRGLFLGTLIFNVADDVHDKITIVDGQQRLTTIFLLLIACRLLAVRLQLNGVAQETQKRITVTDPTTAKSRGPLLVASESIRDAYEMMAGSDWDGTLPAKIGKHPIKRQTKRIRPVFDAFQKVIENYDQDKLSRLLDSVYRTRVIRIDIDGDEEAFSIFERTNDRGTDLEVSDLLKNYLYQQKVPELDDKWKQILENSDRTIVKMLKYFYIAKKGHVSKSDLFPKLKAYALAIGGADGVVEELRQFSVFYQNVRKEANASATRSYFESVGCKGISSDVDKFSRVHLAFQALRLFRVSQTYPVIYAAIEAQTRTGVANDRNSAKVFIKLVEAMEKYHFINNAICNRVGNEVEKLYASFCPKFVETKDFQTTAAELMHSLKSRLASEEEFVTRFCEITYGPETIALISYVFDRFSNYKAAPGERVSIFDPQAGVSRFSHNIEHFLPQKPDSDTTVDSATRQVIDSIGNLLVISIRANSSLGNLSPVKKIQRLKGDLSKKVDNLHYVREFIEVYGPKAEEWNDRLIAERASAMAKNAYRQIWQLS